MHLKRAEWQCFVGTMNDGSPEYVDQDQLP